MADESTGTIVGILGDLVEVSFAVGKPGRHELLTISDDPEIRLEVYASSAADSVYCL